LKNRLKKEGSESVTKCNRLKMTAVNGKSYLTDVARTKRRDDPVDRKHEGKNGINRRKGMLSLHQLLDKIGELDEKQIPVPGFWRRTFLIRGMSGFFCQEKQG